MTTATIAFERLFIGEIGTVSSTHPVEILISKNICFPINNYDFLLKEIENFRALTANWDGYNSTPVLASILDKTIKFIGLLNSFAIDNISDIYPNPHGTLTLEWVNRTSEKLSLEFGENNYSYFIKYNNSNPKLVDGEDIFGDLKNFTRDLGVLFGNSFSEFVFNH